MNPTSTGKVTNRYYYHTNQLGSIIAISTSTGQVVQKYTYNAYGKPYIYSGITLTPLSSYTGTLYGNTRLYTGREYDRETGYYYLRARIYSPDLGRFLSRDPIGQNDQVNLYTYVKNSPLNYTDRNGKMAKRATVAVLTFGLKAIIGFGDLMIGGIEQAGDDQELSQKAYEEDENLQLHGLAVPGVAIVKGLLKQGAKFFVKGVSIEGKQVDEIFKNPEVRNTLQRIEKGEAKYSGKDGETYVNDGRQGGQLLPKKTEGYYQEWTVDTPGLSHRGEQRIITGDNGEMFYTNNHYGTFTQIK